VLADDSVLLREGVSSLLRMGGHEVVAAVGDGAELVSAVRSLTPDLAIVDVRMPPTFTDEGLRAALQLRRENGSRRVMVLSQYVDHASAGELLSLGNSGVGYLLKDRVGDVAEFLHAAERVAAGESVIDPDVVRRLLARQRNQVSLSRLTARETEVLALMAEGMTNIAIANKLVVSEAAVAKHVNGIFTKLNLQRTEVDHRRVQAVVRFLGG
jgi:DNA-binding NarL/FixJ family response regulator